jgi:predicted rRNA methylase YqxC with S4 and FtsJ domains
MNNYTKKCLYQNLSFLLAQKLKKDVLDEFKSKTICDLLVSDDVFEDSLFSLKIKSLYKKGLVNDKFLEKAVEESIFNQARKDYNFLISRNGSKVKTAEKLENPEYLSYALKKGYFSKEEIKKISFGNNLDFFVDFYSVYGLVSVCREELLY